MTVGYVATSGRGPNGGDTNVDEAFDVRAEMSGQCCGMLHAVFAGNNNGQ